MCAGRLTARGYRFREEEVHRKDAAVLPAAGIRIRRRVLHGASDAERLGDGCALGTDIVAAADMEVDRLAQRGRRGDRGREGPHGRHRSASETFSETPVLLCSKRSAEHVESGRPILHRIQRRHVRKSDRAVSTGEHRASVVCVSIVNASRKATGGLPNHKRRLVHIFAR